MKKELIISLMVAMCISIIIHQCTTEKKRPEREFVEVPMEEWEAQKYLYSPVELLDIYEANEINADETLMGDPIHVKGLIMQIDKDSAGLVYVWLYARGFKGIKAQFDTEKNAKSLKHLLRGDSLWYSGYVDGFEKNIVIRMSDCEVKMFQGVKRFTE